MDYTVSCISSHGETRASARAVALGRRAGLATVVGNAAGACSQVTAVALGLGAIVERSVQVFTVLKLLGACYIIYLGVHAIRQRRTLAPGTGSRVRRGAWRRLAGPVACS
jgi:threonine/homoserine/homoserine lactone efflux protein